MTSASRAGDPDQDPAAATLLLGTISLDRYVATGEVLPGGGVLNMAWHWRHPLARPFRVLTRVGEEDRGPIQRFLDRHGIETVVSDEVVAPGRSSSIDIEIQPDRQPWMDNFVAGVWDDYRLTTRELEALDRSSRLHVVLVEGAIAELHRLGAGFRLVDRQVSADFLGFRHYTVERLAETMGYVDVGFIGWPGAEDAVEVAGMRRVAFELGKSIVVTLGARAVLVFDGERGAERRYPVTPVEVTGTTLGCGDAFISWFLDELWRSGDHDAAVAQGMIGGAQATAWERPLPDDAYGPRATGRQPKET
jgi:sugar/nucleoside kinase (ribokinase family)